MYLRDRVSVDGSHDHGYNISGGAVRNINKSKDNCKRYNRGKCTNGPRCQYQHKCDICGKYGHGAHICRKRKQSGLASTSTAKEGDKLN